MLVVYLQLELRMFLLALKLRVEQMLLLQAQTI